MLLTRENIQVFAARYYKNELCLKTDDFEEDFKKISLCKKHAKKISQDKTSSIRLLCNHVICVTNVFELHAVKEMFRLICDDELTVVKTVLTYLSLLDSDEWADVSFCIKTAKLLKEMDR